MSKPSNIGVVQSLAASLVGVPDLISEGGLQHHFAGRLASAGKRLEASSSLVERQGSISVFKVHGVLSPAPFWYDEINSKELAEQLRLAKDDDEVVSGLMDIDSPGGYSQGMIDLAAAAREFAAVKPLIAHARQYCCSGAFWLAAQATTIYAEVDAEIGSIGVRSLLYDYSKYFAELGIEAIATDTGPYKSLGALGTPITEEQRAYLQERVDNVMADFTKAVKKCRKLSADEFAAVATGRTWEGQEAVSLKLIDGVQSLKKTMAGLVAGSKPKNRSKAMSTTTEDNTPKIATHDDLTTAMPEASAEFILGQLKAKATTADALKAYNSHLAAELKKSKEEAEASEARAKTAEEKAAKVSTTTTTAAPAKVRGHKPSEATGEAGESETGAADYTALAQEYQKKHNCRWSEATLAIKKRYPEARAFFGAPKA